MLHIINNLQDEFLRLIKDDPVRPDIPAEFRVTGNRFVSALIEEQPRAMVCVSLHDFVPTDVEDLKQETVDPTIAIFYTIWSYAPGAGAKLLQTAAEWLRRDHKDLKGIVTLSPQTAMAERFHLKNGAKIRKTNRDTVNYEYYFRDAPAAD